MGDKDDGECWFFNSQDGMQLLSSNLRGTFLLFAIGKNGAFDCLQGSWARPGEFIQGEGNEGSHLLEQPDQVCTHSNTGTGTGGVTPPFLLPRHVYVQGQLSHS